MRTKEQARKRRHDVPIIPPIVPEVVNPPNPVPPNSPQRISSSSQTQILLRSNYPFLSTNQQKGRVLLLMLHHLQWYPLLLMETMYLLHLLSTMRRSSLSMLLGRVGGRKERVWLQVQHQPRPRDRLSVLNQVHKCWVWCVRRPMDMSLEGESQVSQVQRISRICPRMTLGIGFLR